MFWYQLKYAKINDLFKCHLAIIITVINSISLRYYKTFISLPS